MFGGRGAKSSGGGGGGAAYTGDTSIADTSGGVIDLSDTPLIYGDLDSALTGNARTVIEQFENRRYTTKTEYSRFIDSNGNIIEENHGGRGSVGATMHARQTADAMSHNHPRGDGGLGGTFSEGDISNFSRFNQTTYRATAKEGTYSISKTGSFNGKALSRDYDLAVKRMETNLIGNADSVKLQYRTGKISYNQAVTSIQKLNNAFLVEMHNWLLNNQSNYGYTYTLERRS